MKGKKEKLTESVKLDPKVVAKVRKYVAKTSQTIGGFISREIEMVIEGKEKVNP